MAPYYDNMAYVADLTIPDWTYMNPGQYFVKTWRIVNNGTTTWNNSFRLVFVQGSQMGGVPTYIQGTVNPGQNYDISVGMTAPTTPGSYQGWWQMVNGSNVPFGQRIYVAITVPGAPTAVPTQPAATAVPTQPPAATAVPTQPPAPTATQQPSPTPIPTVTPTVYISQPIATAPPSISQPIATPPTAVPLIKEKLDDNQDL